MQNFKIIKKYILDLNGGYKCEHNKLNKIYVFGFKAIIYFIKLENKQIVFLRKMNKSSNKNINLNNEKQIYEELLLIKTYLEQKIIQKKIQT